MSLNFCLNFCESEIFLYESEMLVEKNVNVRCLF